MSHDHGSIEEFRAFRERMNERILSAGNLPNGFSMQNNGYEYQLMLLAASLAFAIGGGGAAAVDDIIASRAARES